MKKILVLSLAISLSLGLVLNASVNSASVDMAATTKVNPNSAPRQQDPNAESRTPSRREGNGTYQNPYWR